jgi:hypothetical protein
VTGFVHILRDTAQQAPGTLSYTVIFAPIGPTGTGGAVPSKNLRGKDGLVEFLKRRMHISERRIQDALQDLETNGNASIALVDLPEDELRDLRLIQVG